MLQPKTVSREGSPRPSPDPVVDGTLGVSEWKEGIEKDVLLYDLKDELETMDLKIQSVYGNDYYIYFGVTFIDAEINPEDYFFIVFKTIEGDPLFIPPYNESGSFGREHDVKMLWLHNNFSNDAFTTGSSYTWDDDVTAGGTNDGIAKCHFNGTHTTIEMRYLFDTGDTLGHDFKLSLGVRIAITLWFHDETKKIDYCQVMETTLDYEWLDLYIGCTPAPIPLAFIILGLATTAAVSLIIKRRRK